LIEMEEVIRVEPAPAPESPSPVEAVPAEPEAVSESPPPADGASREDLASVPSPETEEEEGGLTIAERLQPRLGDPRVWEPIPSRYRSLSAFEQAELMVLGMLQSWNDSMAVATARSDAAQDWTYTDAEGRRWGLAPGRLFLGDFSIPLPAIDFVQRGLIEDRLIEDWTAADLARGAATAQIRQTWLDRARAIRERMEAERADPPARAEAGAGG
jgi:hypothetical protein